MPGSLTSWNELENLANWASVLSFLLTLGVLFFSSQIWRAFRRKTAPITIVLCARQSKDCLDLPYRPRRDTLTRGELLGILGMYHGEKRFHTSQVDLYPVFSSGYFEAVVSGKRTPEKPSADRLEIQCDREFFIACENNIARGGPESEPEAEPSTVK